MPRVVMVMATPADAAARLGGLETHTLTLASALAATYDLHLIIDQGYVAAFKAQLPTTVHIHGLNFQQSRWNPRLYYQLGQLLKHLNPALIHAQAGKAASLIRRTRWLFQLKQPWVATVHGTKRQLQGYLAADYLICVSQQQAEQLPPGVPHRVIPNGIVPPAVLSPDERAAWLTRRLRPTWPLCLAIGRLEPVKGFTTLLDAMAGLEAELWIIGDGSQQGVLTEQADQLNARGAAILLLGHVEQASRLYQLADLAVMSSQREGFPLVLAEALTQSCPVVGTQVSGLTEWLSPQDLCPPDRPEALHQLLASRLADRAGLVARQQALFKQAQSQLTLMGMAMQTQAVYEPLV